MSYTKLFSSIITSSLWSEDASTCKLWVTMMALADKHGEVSGTVPGLARVASLDVPEVETALERFKSPDPYSRTKDDDGRRIEEIEGGWMLLNHAKYREMASKEDQKRQNAARQKQWRDRQKRNGNVTDRNGKVTQDRDIAEAEAEAESLNRESKKRGKVVVNRKSKEKAEETTTTPLYEIFIKIGSAEGIPEDFCRETARKAIESGVTIQSPGAYLGAAWANRDVQNNKSTPDSQKDESALGGNTGANREVWKIEKDIARVKAERIAIQKSPDSRMSASGTTERKDEHRARLEPEWLAYLREAATEFEETLPDDWKAYQKAMEEDRANLAKAGYENPDIVDGDAYRLERLAEMFPKDVAEFERWAEDWKKEPWIDPTALSPAAKSQLNILKDALQRLEEERKAAMLNAGRPTSTDL